MDRRLSRCRVTAMPLISLPGIGYIRSEDKELDRQLREGDGLVWSGDPSLELRYGIASAPRRMQHPTTGKWLNRGDMIAKRYEVWTHTPDGEDEPIGHWTIEEFDRILFDIAGMKAGFEGKRPDVIERIDLANAKVEKAQVDQFRDRYGEMYDHAARLAHDISNPQTTFRQMGGSDDRADRNLQKA